MANLDQICDYLADNDQKLIYDEFSNSNTVNLSNGTIGTYANGVTIDVSKTGYTPISCSFVYVGHGSSYHAFCNLNSNILSILFYRTSSSAYTVPANDVKVNVIYSKNS